MDESNILYPSIQFLRLELENFSRIKSGMGIDKLTIDFNKLDHRITLLVGENGSGKTSVMRCFHPFAYNNGSGDDGENAELISEGKDGRKCLSIGYQNDFYEVEHLYIRKKDTLTVKSYLKKNGEELNPSGNVTSFKDWMETLFDLKESYLALLSIGNTVSSFVKFTAGERKKFAIKLFSILNIYTMFYKNATAMVREVKPLLSNVSAKLEKYRQYNVDDLEKERVTLGKSLIGKEDSLRELLTEIGEVSGGIKIHEGTINDYNAKKDRVLELHEYINKLNQFGSVRHKDELMKLYSDKNGEVASETAYLSAIATQIELELSSIDDKNRRLEELQKTESKMQSDTDIHELEELKARLEAELAGLDLEHRERPSISSSELIRKKIYMDELRGMCIDLITEVLNQKLIPETIRQYLEQHDSAIRQLEDYLRESEDRLETYKVSQAARRILPVRRIDKLTDFTCDNVENCQYVKFYNDVYRILSASSEEANEIINGYQSEVNTARDKYTAVKIISRLYHYVINHRDEFNLPEVFDPTNFLYKYMNERDICDRELLTFMIEEAEAFEKGDSLKEELSDTIDRLANVSVSREYLESVQNEILSLQNGIKVSRERLDNYEKDHAYRTDKLNIANKELESLKKELAIASEITDARMEMEDLKDDIAQMEGSMNQIRVLQSKLHMLEATEDHLRNEIDVIRNRINEISTTIDTIDSLESEQADLYEKLNQRIAIQTAVSPVSGIPLEFINHFIKNDLIQMVNDILDTVYHGRLRLDGANTVIDDSNFIIPYIVNGTFVGDISRASDGQKAILTLAFSISLIKMTGGRYNVMLLDEMDTTLDVSSKAKFIELLENYAVEINAWMIFLISHNSMFDGHPVNILLTSDQVVSNTQDATVVKLYKGGNG